MNGLECPPVSPTRETPIVFAARRTIRGRLAGVRESGQGPDDPDGRSSCWHHQTEGDCRAYATKLENDRAVRRLTSVGIDATVWIHARNSLRAIPQRSFLERHEPTRRWVDGGTPPLGLARAAVLYHLPALGSPALTPGQLFLQSNLCARICPSEVEWLDAQCHARISYFQVMPGGRTGVVLRDCFGDLSGRRDIEVRTDELDGTPLAPGHTVFARLIPYRNGHYVDHQQSEHSARVGIADPLAAVKGVWSGRRSLRDRTAMTETLFENWKRRT